MKKVNKSLILTVIIFILSSSLYSFKLFTSYNFDNDFARDLIEIKNIIGGHLTFIGPGASIGIQTGPYYYYLFTPVAALSNLNINSILLFNSLLFALSIAFLAYFFSLRYGLLKASLVSTSIAMLPAVIISARNPGNAFSYVPFLIILLTIVTVKNENKHSTLLLMGLFSGLIVNFHYANFLIILSLLLYFLIILKKKKKIFIYIFYFFITFIPLGLFEIKHNFVMTKNIFLNQAYRNFTNNTQLVGSESAKANIFNNLIFISNKATQYLSLQPFIIFIIGLFAISKKYFQKETLLFLSSIFSFILLILTMRSQFVYFYLFPIILFLAFSTSLVIIKSKYYLLLVIFILFEIVSFPVNLFTASHRPYSNFENAVNFVIDKKLITTQKFNVLQIRPDTITAPYGNEYRIFFMKKGYVPQSYTEYNTANQLIIFSEIAEFDLKNLKNFEFTEFGSNYNVKKYTYKRITIYSLIK